MAGNSFGGTFGITTFGESHGPAIGVIVDGVPPNIPLTEDDIQYELNRRRPGQSSVTTQRNESDQATILSGVFEGKTTGTALAILIPNRDQRSKDYAKLQEVLRPGHADFTYLEKYGIRDHRGSGRASGRETAGRVAAGAIAKKILQKENINVVAYTLAIGEIVAEKRDYAVIEKNIVRCPDSKMADRMIERIKQAQESQDSVGGIIEAIVHGCPAGLGEPVFDKLNAQLAHAVLSIGAIRGIEFGAGFNAATMTGSQHNDKYFKDGERIRTRTNHSGGILGGISTGEDIILRAAVKPTSSIAQKQNTLTTQGESIDIEIEGRHDPCLCPRMVVVVEAMIAIVLVNALMVQKAIGR